MRGSDVVRDSRGRWCLAVPRERAAYGATGAVRVLKVIPGVPRGARRSEAVEAAGRALAAGRWS